MKSGTRRVLSTDGTALYAEERGTGPSMLLCNGMFCSTHYYAYLQSYYAARFRVVSFDYRSHGKSDEAPEPNKVTLSALTGDAQAVLRACCDGPTVLVGHSMGVRTALELYKREPSRVSALVLMCGSAWDALGPTMSRWPIQRTIKNTLHVGGSVPPVTSWMKSRVLGTGLIEQVGYLVGGISKTLTPREPLDGLMRNLERLDTRVMSSLARSYFDHDSRAILRDIRIPTLFVVGERDALAPPSHARKVARLSRFIETYTVADCTHLALIERPEDVHREVDSFLRHRLLT